MEGTNPGYCFEKDCMIHSLRLSNSDIDPICCRAAFRKPAGAPLELSGIPSGPIDAFHLPLLCSTALTRSGSP